MSDPLWSLDWNASPAALALAREAGLLLLRDEHHWLSLFNRRGKLQGQLHRPTGLITATISEDGSAIVLIDRSGTIAWLGPDFHPIWERSPGGKWLAVTPDVTGDYCLASDTTGRLILFDNRGELVREYRGPRAIHHLLFVPTMAHVLAAGEFGFVGRLALKTGDWVWRDAPVVYHGSLSAAASGEPAAVACFSDGLRAYRADGAAFPLNVRVPPCRLAYLSADGQRLLTVGVEHELTSHDLTSGKSARLPSRGSVTSAVLEATGEVAYLATSDRKIIAVELSPATVS